MESDIKDKLEIIRELSIGFKHSIDNLRDDSDKTGSRIGLVEAKQHELSVLFSRADGRIATIEKSLDSMASDTRSIKNSVVGAIIVAIMIGIAGLAIESIKQPSPTPQTTPRSA